MRCVIGRLFCIVAVLVLVGPARADVGVKKTDSGVEVTLDGQPFATYVFNSGFKPIIWPIIGPTGKEMTRAWPLRELPPGDKSEAVDHVHQKSFWFDHGNVNGIDFWAETSRQQGKQKQTELIKAEGGKVGTVVTKNDWVGPDGMRLLTDVRTVRFGGDKETRWIDFDVVVTAVADEVTFGDTKEGSFGLRIAESMRVDKKTGGKITTSEGLENEKAWGKPAAWVDYHGPVQGETLGIAILNHPSSFRYPTHWHVRTYGLFAANPWGLHDFTNGKEESALKMKKGDSFSLRYRVIFHKGDEKQGKIAEAFAGYTKE
jgi:methane monooxygenase PmoA-like